MWSVGVRCVGGAALPTDSEDTCTAYEDSVVNTIKKYKVRDVILLMCVKYKV